MKIIQLHAENIKRVRAVDITPSEDVVIISGMNEQGKTSVIDSIWLALEYRAATKDNPTPLRAGEDNGMVTLDLGEYIVTRKFTPSGTTLEIRTPDGSKISSPQKLLDGLIGSLSFDPWEFSNKSEKDQREMLADVLFSITDGKLNLADFDRRHQEAFDKRTEANREKKRVASLLSSILPPTNQDPTEEISSEDLTKSIADAISLHQDIVSTKSQLDKYTSRVLELERELQEQRSKLEMASAVLASLPEVPDINFLKSELQNIEKNNRRAREVQEYQKLRKGLTLVEQEITELNDSMELIEIEKAEALENSPLPVNGIQIVPEGIMITNEDNNLVPFSQASAARRLRISLAIAMAANPKLRVIRIADGSLLDDNSMSIVKDMAKDEDFQVWIEFASRNDQDRIGVYIQDGKVV